jgi:hypothetical protein
MVFPEFVSWFLNSPLGRLQVNAVSRQIMQNDINSKELRSLQIPLPLLSDFNLGKGEALEKGYLNGRYGALPFIGNLRF